MSGIVQQLAATPNAVVYKNFTGDHIEEVTLLKDEFNQTLNTNITENYAPGVTSTINETAPSINHQVTLNESHTFRSLAGAEITIPLHSKNAHNQEDNGARSKTKPQYIILKTLAGSGKFVVF